MKLNNDIKRGLTRDFVSLILSDMKNIQSKEDFIRSSVDYSSSEHQNTHNKIKHLQAIKEAIHQLNLFVSDYCIEQIEIDFLDTIDPRAVIQKREAASLCERSESWLQKGDHKNQFDNQTNGGLNVLSFASYLKESKPFEYQTFIKNYKKEAKSKIR